MWTHCTIIMEHIRRAAAERGALMNDKKNLIPLFSTFLCWGSVYTVSKIALRTIPPVTLLALRYIVAIPTLFILLKVRGALRRMTPADVRTVFVIGFTGYFSSFCLQMMGINRLTGSISSLLGAMNPIFIPVLASVFLKEKLTWPKVACVAISMVGVVLIVGVNGTVDALGAGLMLISVFLWSSTSVIIRRVSGKYDPMQVAMLGMAFGLLFTGIWSAFELRTASFSLPVESCLAVLFMAWVGTAGAHTLWNMSLSRMDASFCSMFYPLQPLTAAVLGVMVLGEKITVNFVVGGLIICCGIVAAVLSGRENKSA